MITEAPEPTETDKAQAAKRPALDRISLENVASWRIGNGGAIVCDCPPDCPEKASARHIEASHERYYGGHFVCESVGGALAEFIVAAARMEWQNRLHRDPRLRFYQCGKHEPPFVWRLAEGATAEPCPRCVLGSPQTIQIRFDGPPGPTSGHFIEVEDDSGKSISVGEWEQDGDDWLLKIPRVRR
jgi:hypothetical protein